MLCSNSYTVSRLLDKRMWAKDLIGQTDVNKVVQAPLRYTCVGHLSAILVSGVAPVEDAGPTIPWLFLVQRLRRHRQPEIWV